MAVKMQTIYFGTFFILLLSTNAMLYLKYLNYHNVLQRYPIVSTDDSLSTAMISSVLMRDLTEVRRETAANNYTNKAVTIKKLNESKLYDVVIDGGFQPAFTLTGHPDVRRSNARLIFGIPTVKREYESYLTTTLTSIFENLSDEENVLIIVFVASFDPIYVKSVFMGLRVKFGDEIAGGLLEAISPNEANYPRDLLDSDGGVRTKWYGKQNIDYANLMRYVQNRGEYYMQLEDDILPKQKFVDYINAFIDRKKVFFSLDFNQMGFIGVLFQTKDLPSLADTFTTYYRELPVDLLLGHFTALMKKAARRSYKYSKHLFRHIGARSSLKGKVHDTKTHAIVMIPFEANPPALDIECDVEPVGNTSVKSVYEGRGYFRGDSAEAGDSVTIHLNSTYKLGAYKFVSGNEEFPEEIITEADVEIGFRQRNSTSDFVRLASFGSEGSVEGVIREHQLVSDVRIRFLNDTRHRVVLSEIRLESAMDCAKLKCENLYKHRKD